MQVGVSRIEGRAVPRFALLAVLQKGDERAFRFLFHQREEGAWESLRAALPEGVVAYEHRAAASLEGVP